MLETKAWSGSERLWSLKPGGLVEEGSLYVEKYKSVETMWSYVEMGSACGVTYLKMVRRIRKFI